MPKSRTKLVVRTGGVLNLHQRCSLQRRGLLTKQLEQIGQHRAVVGVGSYAHARTFPGNPPDLPGLELPNCMLSDGSFQVLELQRDAAKNTVTALALDFSAQCAPPPSPMTTGKFRFNSMVP